MDCCALIMSNHLLDVPGVEARRMRNVWQGLIATQRICHQEEALGRGYAQGLAIVFLTAAEASFTDVQRTHSFLQRLGESATNRHYFADGLHLRPEYVSDTGEFLKVPARVF